MKKLFRIFLTLSLLCFTQLSFAQVEVTEDMLLGTWKIDLEFLKRQIGRVMEEEISRIQNPEEKRMKRRQMQETMDKMSEMIRGFNVVIKNDNTFKFNFPKEIPGPKPNSDEEMGRWQLENNIIKIAQMGEEFQDDKTLTIIDISENKIVFKPTQAIPEAPNLKFALLRE